MSLPWKYLGIRSLSMLMTILIVAMIISAFFVTLREEDQEEAIERQVNRQIEFRQFEDPEEAKEFREDEIKRLKKENNLDGSRAERVWDNARDMLTFDFGKTNRFTDYQGSDDIADIIMQYLPNTIVLFTTGAVIYTSLAIVLGLKAAQNLGSKLDRLTTLFGAVSSSVPIWWAGMIFLLIFSYILGIYPRPYPAFPNVEVVGYLGYLKEFLIKMSLPLFTIVFVKFGANLWISRNIISGVLEDDYIMAARSKGLPENKVIYGHALRTAAPPMMTTAVLALLTSLGGFLIAEVIFQWPGIGYLLRRALYQSGVHLTDQSGSVFEDQLIASITFVLMVISIITFYIADVLYSILDPRVQVGSKFSEGEK